MIEIWYGDEQRFGHLGVPQRWINVLGRVDAERVQQLTYALDGGPLQTLSIGPDGHRLAAAGDFNVELDLDGLPAGRHTLALEASDGNGTCARREVALVIEKGRRWPLPCRICWSEFSAVEEAVQVVDGRWVLTDGGVRSVEPYYDRVLGLGDLSWTDYEVRTTITYHGLRQPHADRDAGANVIHAALAVRWPGHDVDEHQPHVRWYPLGATAEFRVNPSWAGCSWRILGGGSVVAEAREDRRIELERPYSAIHRVESGSNGSACYRVKLWEAGTTEPSAWAVELHKGPADVQRGGALLIAHYAEVTFGDVEVVPV